MESQNRQDQLTKLGTWEWWEKGWGRGRAGEKESVEVNSKEWVS